MPSVLFGSLCGTFHVPKCDFEALLPCRLEVSVTHDANIPQLAFAAQDLNAALNESGRENRNVSLSIRPDDSSPEAFQIRTDELNQVVVVGSDTKGAMYGGLEVAWFGCPLTRMVYRSREANGAAQFEPPAAGESVEPAPAQPLEE